MDLNQQLRQRARQVAEQNQIAPSEMEGFFPSLRQGFAAAVPAAEASLRGMAGVVGDAVGAQDFAADQYGQALRLQQRSQQLAPPVQSWDDAKVGKNFSSYMGALAGGSLPQMAPSIAGAIGGGMLAGPSGAIAGAALPLTAFESGEIANRKMATPEGRAQSPQQRATDALLGGAASAAIQSVPLVGIGGRLVGKPLIEHAVGAGLRGAAARIGGAALHGAVGEGAAEGAGEMIRQYATSQQAPTDWNAVRENAIGGALMGGPLGGAGGVTDVVRASPGNAMGGVRDAAAGLASKVRGAVGQNDRAAQAPGEASSGVLGSVTNSDIYKNLRETGASMADVTRDALTLIRGSKAGAAAERAAVNTVRATLGDERADALKGQAQEALDKTKAFTKESVEATKAMAERIINHPDIGEAIKQEVIKASENLADHANRASIYMHDKALTAESTLDQNRLRMAEDRARREQAGGTSIYDKVKSTMEGVSSKLGSLGEPTAQDIADPQAAAQRASQQADSDLQVVTRLPEMPPSAAESVRAAAQPDAAPEVQQAARETVRRAGVLDSIRQAVSDVATRFTTTTDAPASSNPAAPRSATTTTRSSPLDVFSSAMEEIAGSAATANAERDAQASQQDEAQNTRLNDLFAANPELKGKTGADLSTALRAGRAAAQQAGDTELAAKYRAAIVNMRSLSQDTGKPNVRQLVDQHLLPQLREKFGGLFAPLTREDYTPDGQLRPEARAALKQQSELVDHTANAILDMTAMLMRSDGQSDMGAVIDRVFTVKQIEENLAPTGVPFDTVRNFVNQLPQAVRERIASKVDYVESMGSGLKDILTKGLQASYRDTVTPEQMDQMSRHLLQYAAGDGREALAKYLAANTRAGRGATDNEARAVSEGIFSLASKPGADLRPLVEQMRVYFDQPTIDAALNFVEKKLSSGGKLVKDSGEVTSSEDAFNDASGLSDDANAGEDMTTAEFAERAQRSKLPTERIIYGRGDKALEGRNRAVVSATKFPADALTSEMTAAQRANLRGQLMYPDEHSAVVAQPSNVAAKLAGAKKRHATGDADVRFVPESERYGQILTDRGYRGAEHAALLKEHLDAVNGHERGMIVVDKVKDSTLGESGELAKFVVPDTDAKTRRFLGAEGDARSTIVQVDVADGKLNLDVPSMMRYGMHALRRDMEAPSSRDMGSQSTTKLDRDNKRVRVTRLDEMGRDMGSEDYKAMTALGDAVRPRDVAAREFYDQRMARDSLNGLLHSIATVAENADLDKGQLDALWKSVQDAKVGHGARAETVASLVKRARVTRADINASMVNGDPLGMVTVGGAKDINTARVPGNHPRLRAEVQGTTLEAPGLPALEGAAGLEQLAGMDATELAPYARQAEKDYLAALDDYRANKDAVGRDGQKDWAGTSQRFRAMEAAGRRYDILSNRLNNVSGSANADMEDYLQESARQGLTPGYDSMHLVERAGQDAEITTDMAGNPLRSAKLGGERRVSKRDANARRAEIAAERGSGTSDSVFGEEADISRVGEGMSERAAMARVRAQKLRDGVPKRWTDSSGNDARIGDYISDLADRYGSLTPADQMTLNKLLTVARPMDRSKFAVAQNKIAQGLRAMVERTREQGLNNPLFMGNVGASPYSASDNMFAMSADPAADAALANRLYSELPPGSPAPGVTSGDVGELFARYSTAKNAASADSAYSALAKAYRSAAAQQAARSPKGMRSTEQIKYRDDVMGKSAADIEAAAPGITRVLRATGAVEFIEDPAVPTAARRAALSLANNASTLESKVQTLETRLEKEAASKRPVAALRAQIDALYEQIGTMRDSLRAIAQDHAAADPNDQSELTRAVRAAAENAKRELATDSSRAAQELRSLIRQNGGVIPHDVVKIIRGGASKSGLHNTALDRALEVMQRGESRAGPALYKALWGVEYEKPTSPSTLDDRFIKDRYRTWLTKANETDNSMAFDVLEKLGELIDSGKMTQQQLAKLVEPRRLGAAADGINRAWERHMGGTPDPKALAAKAATSSDSAKAQALAERALSGDKGLIDQIRASDHGPALVRAGRAMEQHGATDTDAYRAVLQRTRVLNQDFASAIDMIYKPDRSYSQDATTPRNMPIDAAEQQRLLGILRKRLGEDVDLQMVDSDYAGSHRMDDATLKHFFEISVHAANKDSVAYHESMHGLFRALEEHGAMGDQTAALLRTAASDRNVVKALSARFRDQPKVMEQLKNAEERAAYMYQLWEEGGLRDVKAAGVRYNAQEGTLGARLTALFTRIKNAIAKAFGVWTEHDRAMHIMEQFSRGELSGVLRNREKLGAIVDRRAEKGFADKAQRTFEKIATGSEKLFDAGATRLRETNIPALMYVADKTKFDHDSRGVSDDPGYIPAQRVKAAEAKNELARAMRGLSEEEIAQAHKALLEETDPAGRVGEMVSAVRSVLRGLRQYATDAGVKMGDLGEKYYPHAWDADYIYDNREAFEAMLSKYADRLGDASPKDIADAILSKPDQFHEMGTPSFIHGRERSLDFIDRADSAPFLQKDMMPTLGGYIDQITRRAEWIRRFNPENGTDEGTLAAKAVEQGATPAQVETMRQYLRGVNGTLGDDINPTLRRYMGNAIVYQNIRLMPLAIFSQVVDPLGVAVRGGGVAGAWKVMKRGFSDLHMAWRKDSTPYEDASYRLAEDLGIIENAMLANHMSALYTQGGAGKTARWLNDRFFKYNFMEQWNRSMRVGAMEAGMQFIRDHAHRPTQHSERYLSELGLTRDDVRVIVDTDGHEMLDTSDPKIVNAISRWVDGAILRPDASERPIWFGDPKFMLISHLKQFSYSFLHTIVGRALHEANHGNLKPVAVLGMYVPVMLASDLLMGLVQGGGEQPPWRRDWGAADYLQNSIQRAGILHLSHTSEAVFDPAFFMGPTLAQAMQGIEAIGGKDQLGNFAVHSLPGKTVFAGW